jgi:F-type H+-transporting ATPase subunit gamma
MLGRTSLRNAGRLARPRVLSTAKRGMATEQQLKMRIRSVGNIEKITKAMKMVAAAKLRRVQENLDIARAFSADITEVWPEPEEAPVPSKDTQHLMVAISADKGLCGAVNGTIIRSCRDRLIDYKIEGIVPSLVLYGDKGRLGLERLFAKQIDTSVSDLSKLKVKTFTQACELSSYILDVEFDSADLTYQHFRSLLSYETTTIPMHSLKARTADVSCFSAYELEGDGDVLQNLHEFRTAVQMFHLFAETDTSELSARMNAMGNSSKNAGEMLEALTLLYNRTRQAKITTELIEIISGATAAEEQVKK